MSVCSATAFIAIVSATILRFILVRLNKRLDRGDWVEGAINSVDRSQERGQNAVGGNVVPKEAVEKGFRFLM